MIPGAVCISANSVRFIDWSSGAVAPGHDFGKLPTPDVILVTVTRASQESVCRGCGTRTT